MLRGLIEREESDRTSKPPVAAIRRIEGREEELREGLEADSTCMCRPSFLYQTDGPCRAELAVTGLSRGLTCHHA
jgi:hypothetical protein